MKKLINSLGWSKALDKAEGKENTSAFQFGCCRAPSNTSHRISFSCYNGNPVNTKCTARGWKKIFSKMKKGGILKMTLHFVAIASGCVINQCNISGSLTIQCSCLQQGIALFQCSHWINDRDKRDGRLWKPV